MRAIATQNNNLKIGWKEESLWDDVLLRVVEISSLLFFYAVYLLSNNHNYTNKTK